MNSDTVRLTIPARLPYVRLPRVAIAGLATRSGFTFDEVEDLRLAVGEVCQILLDGADRDGTLSIEFDMSKRGRIGVEVTTTGPAGRNDAGEAFADKLIGATVGQIEVSDEGRRISFSKETEESD